MALKDNIEDIIKRIPQSYYFDSHSVINELLSKSEYHTEYLRGYSDNKTVAQYHAQIVLMIKATNLANPISENCISQTIYGNLSKNTLWQKK